MWLQTPLRSLGSMSKDHKWRSNSPFIIPMSLQLLVLLTYDFLQPELFLGKWQDSASRTTASSKPLIWGDSCMTHSDDILVACFCSLILIHLATFVEWSEGTVKLLYWFDFLALSSYLIYHCLEKIIFLTETYGHLCVCFGIVISDWSPH